MPYNAEDNEPQIAAPPLPTHPVELHVQICEFVTALYAAEINRETAILTALCPIHTPRRHRLSADFTDDSTRLRLWCDVCEATPEGRAALEARLREIFPAWRRWLCEPDEFRPLSVDRGGVLISQFFPHQGPTRWTFPYRNVVMSGLSLATVVVEAAETSGARLQARVALQHGRAVFLLRSLVEQHEWARRYVEEGVYGTQAIAVSSTQDILDLLEPDSPPELLSVA